MHTTATHFYCLIMKAKPHWYMEESQIHKKKWKYFCLELSTNSHRKPHKNITKENSADADVTQNTKKVPFFSIASFQEQWRDWGGIMGWFVPFLLPWDKQQLESSSTSSVFRADYSIRLYQLLWNKIEWINWEMKALCLWAALQFGLGQKNWCWWCGHHFTALSSWLSNQLSFCLENYLIWQQFWGEYLRGFTKPNQYHFFTLSFEHNNT